jgi:uncharacterized protein with HEPN domain
MRSDKERIEDIKEAIKNIEEYSLIERDDLDNDRLIQVWMVHHIQLIGEAASGISNDLKAKNPDIPWRKIIEMRNFLVHEYFGIDLNEVWRTIKQDIPELKSWLQAVKY